MDDWQLRTSVYRWFVDHGSGPPVDQLAFWLGGSAAVGPALRRLHDAHALVLDAEGAIRMALPFSAHPTPFVVRGLERSWYANCAWDALAIPVAIGCDATIEASWSDTGEPVELAVGGFQRFTATASEGGAHAYSPEALSFPRWGNQALWS